MRADNNQYTLTKTASLSTSRLQVQDIMISSSELRGALRIRDIADVTGGCERCPRGCSIS